MYMYVYIFTPCSPPPTHTHGRSIINLTIGSDDNCLDCTPDELAALVREIRDNSALIGPHTYRLVSYKNTFVGSQLVDWLITKKGYKSNCFVIALYRICSILSFIVIIQWNLCIAVTAASLLQTLSSSLTLYTNVH